MLIEQAYDPPLTHLARIKGQRAFKGVGIDMNNNPAVYITSKNNVQLDYKDMDHAKNGSMIRGPQFSAFVVGEVGS